MEYLDSIKPSVKIFLLSILIFSCTTQNEEESDPGLPVIICQTEIKSLVIEEKRVFESLYPELSFTLSYLDKVTPRKIGNENIVYGVISFELNDTLKSHIINDRKLDIDSSAFVFQKKFRTNKFLLYKFYEFDPSSNGPVQQFASFVCGPRGQLIAKKEGYLPVRPPERKVDIKEEF